MTDITLLDGMTIALPNGGLAGCYPNPFGRVAFIVGLANDVTIAAGAVVVVVVCPIVIWPAAAGAVCS